jgi:hypothetical protein
MYRGGLDMAAPERGYLIGWVEAKVAEIVSQVPSIFPEISQLFVERFELKIISTCSVVKKRGMRPHGGTKANGSPFVQMEILRYKDCEYTSHIEYAHIAADPEIGKMDRVHWTKSVAAMVCHEIAHAIEYWFESRTLKPQTSFAYYSPGRISGHGSKWQSIYRILRNRFVNGFDIVPVSKPVKVAKTRESSFVARRQQTGYGSCTSYFSKDMKMFFGVIAYLSRSKVYRAYVGHSKEFTAFPTMLAARNFLFVHEGEPLCA